MAVIVVEETSYLESFWTFTVILADALSWLQVWCSRKQKRCFYSGNLCHYVSFRGRESV